ncbi:hypothetical protein [Planococcus shixiaomingii]|uniref:hypothetical protein n=1 Tax=Planococcus shixiaomingii TaxID=3058393 RepID=UPI0026080D5A|nr:hypothetical protein [Planococcus sp. N022]WKA53176.1 hypothetical protein QWY21_10940 [Planococcus sp. N022]
MNTNKEKLLNIIGKEIDLLLSEYEATIKKQIEEIVVLNKALQESDIEKKIMKKEIEALKIQKKENERGEITAFYDKPIRKEQKSTDDTKIVEDIADILKDAFRKWRRMDIEGLTQIFATFNSEPELLKQGNYEAEQLFLKLFKPILLKEDLNEWEHDQLIIEVILLLANLKDSPFQGKIIKFLQVNYEKILDNVLSRNVPSIITSYLRIMLLFNQKEEVQKALVHLLKVEWSFIENSLAKEDFEFFLWYTYLFGLDEELIDKSSSSLQWFNEDSSEIALYFYFNKEVNNHIYYQKKVDEFLTGKVMTDEEKKLILQKIDKEREAAKNAKPYYIPTSKRLIKVIDSKKIKSYIIALNLFKQTVNLPTYTDGRFKVIYSYIETNAILASDNTDDLYIASDDLKSLEERVYPGILKTIPIEGNIIDNSLKLVEKNIEERFSWPSTEVNESDQNLKNEEKLLNEKSELNLLGYQITGSTRARRWEALEKAVPKLGLKKVAYTISYNVKLRKGQKNGERKFHYAITEWEYDLEKLKKYYYKNDFKWPESLK